MANLFAIVRATRQSANALATMQRMRRKLTPLGTLGCRVEAERALRAATRQYEAAKRTLANNPLPSLNGTRH